MPKLQTAGESHTRFGEDFWQRDSPWKLIDTSPTIVIQVSIMFLLLLLKN